MTASWEGIARALKDAPVSDVELADRLGCKPQLVAQVRADLGQPALPVPCPSAPLTVDERFELLAVVVPGGHVRGGAAPPEMAFRSSTVDDRATACVPAYLRREPEGQVRGSCRVNHCLEGLHLTTGACARGQVRHGGLDACL
ncbi:hypothetical protein E4K10_30130 [Streptomyces sp. T1317-0309]|nr:hypothetical protein E4K10_30130 [Streptomyces sp. T1317-0309]